MNRIMRRMSVNFRIFSIVDLIDRPRDWHGKLKSKAERTRTTLDQDIGRSSDWTNLSSSD